MKTFPDHPDFTPNVSPKDVFKKELLEGRILELLNQESLVKPMNQMMQSKNIQKVGGEALILKQW